MKKNIHVILICFSIISLLSCNKKIEDPKYSVDHISSVVSTMTDIMVNDISNPPLAARFFTYACLAGYEVIAQNDSSFESLHGRLNGYPEISKPDIDNYSIELTSLLAMIETASKMQPSGNLLQKLKEELIAYGRKEGLSKKTVENSSRYAQYVGSEILKYANADRYNKISNYQRYTPEYTEGFWHPTPPGFMAPVEPYFHTIRPFTLDTCNQFAPIPPIKFSMEKDSEFYKLVEEVYKETSNLSEEKKLIASFWDCNPFALMGIGHLLVGIKKISPGAHWMGITGIACKQSNVDFAQSLKIHTVVAMALMDGFLACWDEKYRSNRVRPETVINKYIDPEWKPLLQTPPFPEYLSGHSTISSAAAVVLTHYFGENYSFTDTIEVKFGLPARSFQSFYEAAEEAGTSRLYGGIHFSDAISHGQIQGENIGKWVVKRIERNR